MSTERPIAAGKRIFEPWSPHDRKGSGPIVQRRSEAHGAILRIRAKDPLIADQVAVNYRKADITPRQRAMLGFAMKVSNDSRSIRDEDFETLHGHGLSNRMANFTSMRPNDEFYAMGRTPVERGSGGA